MAFNVVTIRSVDDRSDDDLYPTLNAGSVGRPFAVSPGDGAPAPFVASAVKVVAHTKGGEETVFSLDDVKIEALVTDTRLVFGCSTFDKGGGWSGLGVGALIAVVANGVSKARAAHRRRGKALVGQVRYPWLIAAGGHAHQGWLDGEQLRLTLRRTDQEGGEVLSVTLAIDKQVDSATIAQEITRRAAQWRLTHDNCGPEEELSLRELVSAPKLVSAAKEFAMHRFPSSYPASASTADPHKGRGLPALGVEHEGTTGS